MMAERHALIGAAGWVALEPLIRLPVGELAAGTAVAAAAALVPDLDAVGSKASRSLGVLTKLTAVGVRKASGGHRKATHSLYGLFVATVLVCFPAVALRLPWWTVAAFAAGYGLHLLADCMTVGGCPLLWWPRRPAWQARIFWVLPRRLRCRTGDGFGEWLASSTFVVLSGAVLLLGSGVIR